MGSPSVLSRSFLELHYVEDEVLGGNQVTFGGFKGAGEPGMKVPFSADDRDRWITRLDDGSFIVEFRGGQFADQRSRGYDVVIGNGRRERRAAARPKRLIGSS